MWNYLFSTGMTALMYACSSGHSDVARTLLQAGAEVNKVDNLNKTALFHATKDVRDIIMFNRLDDIVKLLLQHGAGWTHT